MASLTRTELGERVEQTDFEHATSTSLLELGSKLMEGLVVGDGASDSAPKTFVIHGFESADGYGELPGTVVTINRGKGIVGLNEKGASLLGFMLMSGASSRNRDMNGRPNGTYGVYVRGELRDDNFENRAFWESLADPVTETSRNIATKKMDDWSLAIETVPPGPEYVLVGTLVKSGATLTLTDSRPHFFEGVSTNSYAVVDAEWGGGNDRSSNRGLYGVRSLRRFARGVLRQLQDIIGGAGWWTLISGTADGVGIRSLTQLNAEKLARNGAQSMTGTLSPDADNTRDIGTTILRWASGYFVNVRAQTIYVQDESQFRFSSGGTFYKWFEPESAVWSDSAVADITIKRNASNEQHRVHASATLTSDTLINIDINLPNGVSLDEVRVFCSNTGSGSTLIRVCRIDMTTGTVSDLLSTGAVDPGDLSAASVLIGAEVDITPDQNNIINTAIYRYFVSYTAKAAAVNNIYAVRAEYSTDRIRQS